jgi:hypothetical protein
MAAIPDTIVLPSVTPRIDAPDTQQDVQPLAAEGLQKIGDASLKTGQFFGQLQTTDVLNQAGSQADAVLDHVMQLRGQDALTAIPAAQKQVQDIYSKARSQLGSLDQIGQFDQTAGQMVTRYYGRYFAEKGQEAQVEYAGATNQQLVDTSNHQSYAATTLSDPAASDASFQDSLKTGRSAAVQATQLAGNEKDPAIVTDAVRQSDSRQASIFIEGWLNKNPTVGAQFLQKYAPMLDPQAYQTLYRAARSATLPMDSNAIADGVLGIAGPQATSGGTAATGGQRPVNNPGNLRVPGSKTDFQQFPTQQAGVQALQDQLILDNKPVAQGGHGLTTLAQIIGDPVHGWAPSTENNTAAYIANVSSWTGIDPNKPIDLSDPATRNAVTAAIIRQEGGSRSTGGAQALQEMGANLPALMDQAGQQAMKLHPDDADNAYQSASYAVYRKYQSMVVSNDAAQKANLLTVANAVTQGKFTDPDQIFKAGGATAQAWVNLDPDARATVFTLMKHNLPGADVVWSPQAQSMSDQLVGLSITDPAAFRKVNLLDPHYLDVMPHDMISALSNRQTDAMATASRGVSDDDIRSALSFVSPLAISGGINPKAIEGTSDYQTYQQFVGAFTADVSAYFDQHSRMPDAATQQQIARRLLIKGTVAGTGSMFFGPKSEYLFEAEGQGGNLPGFQAIIPPDQLSAINTAYSKMYGHPPDMATATQLYLESLAPKPQ